MGADYHVVRGAEVLWRLRFYDADSNIVSPPSATLYVAYKSNGQQHVVTIPLIGQENGLWVAEWDSSVADQGYVYWHARCSGPTPAASDGRIFLVANPANPNPA